jgi:U3 small nucleolar RNA-associated protein 19
MSLSAETVRAAEARIASDRKHANELIELIELCVTRTAKPAARLAAMQACRSLFSSWAISGDLQLRPTEEDMAGDGSAAEPLAVYRAWLLRSYRKLLSALSATLSDSRTPLALTLPALDSLVMLAAVEARHSRAGRVDPSMLDAAHGAYRLTLDALIHARTPPSQEVLERLRSAHLTHLDASFYLLSHVRRLARAEEAPPPKRVERLLTLLLLVKPPSKDVAPRAAVMLAAPPLPTKLTGKRARAAAAEEAEAGGGGSNSERAAELREWPPEAKQLLGKQRHRAAYDKAWRALLALPMPAPAFRQVLRALPEGILPHVPVPLRYCDVLSDGYARGGVEAVLALRGLFVLMTRHHLEYPHLYKQLYAVLTAEALNGAHRAVFAAELKLFLSSVALPAYLLAAFCKRLLRLALHASPSGAALGCALAFNVMLQHPSARVLIHRAKRARAGGEEGEGEGEEDGGEEDEGVDEEADEATEEGGGNEDGGPRPSSHAKTKRDSGASSAAGALASVAAAAPAADPRGRSREISGDLGGGRGSAEDAALLAAIAAADPFRMEESDPAESMALDSSLWEVEQLRQHCCPTVASLAGLFAAPMLPMTAPVELEPLAALTYSSLGLLETRKRLREVPLAVRPPASLFGATPPGMPPGMAPLLAGLNAWQ